MFAHSRFLSRPNAPAVRPALSSSGANAESGDSVFGNLAQAGCGSAEEARLVFWAAPCWIGSSVPSVVFYWGGGTTVEAYEQVDDDGSDVGAAAIPGRRRTGGPHLVIDGEIDSLFE